MAGAYDPFTGEFPLSPTPVEAPERNTDLPFIAAALSLGVFVRHNASNTLSEESGFTPAAVFYILGGAWEFILCSSVLMIAKQMKRSVWVTIIMMAMLIGMVESAQIPVCRLAVSDIRAVPAGMSLCDYVLGGFQFGVVVACLYLIIFCLTIGRYLAPRTGPP